MKTKAHFGSFACLIALVIALPALAYDYPLSSEAVREAYMLGKADSAKRVDFFAKYTQRLPLPKTGPHVAMIQLETPFAVVVEHTAQAFNYYAPDAAEEFAGKPALLRVRVEIYFTDSYNAHLPSITGGVRLRSSDFWHDFKIRLIQDKEIHAQTIHGSPIYSSSNSASVLRGAAIDLEYDAAKIKSDDATVDVVKPDGQEVKATFDLGTLR